jgi:hypothetical protein
MQRDFTGEDRDKPIEDENGTEIGTVDLVDGDRAEVSANQSMTSAVKDFLGWDEADDAGEVKRDHVEEAGDDKFRIDTSETGGNDGV